MTTESAPETAPLGVVLFIDDDEGARDYAQALLADEPIELILAQDGFEGIRVAHARRPDLVLCDLTMPGIDGFGVLAALRADPLFANTRIVMVTAREDRATFRKAMNLGADDFIAKPFRRDELVDLIVAQLQRPGRDHGASTTITRALEDSLLTASGRMEALTIKASVLFSDMRAFTTYAEALDAAEVAELLRRWFRLASVPLHEQGARTLKFIGDGVMALFDDMAGREPHARRAVLAARGIATAAEHMRAWAEERYEGRELPPFRVGVGLHSGEVAISVLGEGRTAEVTTLGDTVNLAARIEEMTKSLGCTVLASADTIQAMGAGIGHEPMRRVAVRGRAAPIDVAEILPHSAAGVAAEIHQELPPDTLKAIRETAENASLLLTSKMKSVNRGDAHADLSSTVLLVADRLGVSGYRSLSCLGTGRLAEVYLVERETGGKRFALKLFNHSVSADIEFRARVLGEYELVSQIDHPNVAKVIEQGLNNDDRPYIVMEYFERGDLRRRIAQGILLPDALRYVGEAGQGLAELHRNAMVHRDIKPASLMLRVGGILAVADFGIGRAHDVVMGQASASILDARLDYQSPEQACGERLDGRSDLYSLGLVFHEMLTGERAQGAMSNETKLPRLTGELLRYQKLLDQMIHPDPARRFHNADEMLEALADLRIVPLESIR